MQVLPGEVVGLNEEFQGGAGTKLVFDNNNVYIVATLAGTRVVQPPPTKGNGISKPIITIASKVEKKIVVPKIGDFVTGRVTKINQRFASVMIICVGDHVLSDTFNAMIRQQEVRATEIDKVEICKSFRLGDIVRAQVISLGDSRSFLLSTAQNQLGVIFATGPSGAAMVPISWEEVIDPLTRVKEYRKVAKPLKT